MEGKGDRSPCNLVATSQCFELNSLRGAATRVSKFVATPWSVSSDQVSFGQRLARTALVIEPPETLVMMSSLRSQPISFRRQRLPRLKRDARKPPPDKAKPLLSNSCALIRPP